MKTLNQQPKAERIFTISASLKMESTGQQFADFRKALDALLETHGITKYPHLTVTISRVNGKRTPIA